jgi:hypothetical protein
MALLGRGRSKLNVEVLLPLVVIIVVLIVWVSGYYISQSWRSPQLLERVEIEAVEYNGSALAASIKNLGEAPIKLSIASLVASNGDTIATDTFRSPIYIDPGEAKQLSLQIPSNASLKLYTAYTFKVAVSWAIEKVLPYHLQSFVLGRLAGRSVEIAYTFLWQSSAWMYGRSVMIDNSRSREDLRDYQVLVTLDTLSLISAGKMRPDCGDIRFIDSNGTTLLSYWIEPNTCNTHNTKIWVKVPLIPGGSTKTIYLYYGNPTATPISNPFSTMFIYEDFEKPPTGLLDGSATYNSTGKWVELTPAEDDKLGHLSYARVPTNPTGFYAKFYFSAGGGDGADAVWLGAYDSNYVDTEEDRVNNGYHFTFDEWQGRIAFTKSIFENGNPIAYTSQSKIDDGRWHLAEIYFWYNGTAACARIYYDGTLKVYACDLTVQPNVVKGQGLIVFGGRTGLWRNWHRIRGPLYIVKYTSPEPTVNIGPEIRP